MNTHDKNMPADFRQSLVSYGFKPDEFSGFRRITAARGVQNDMNLITTECCGHEVSLRACILPVVGEHKAHWGMMCGHCLVFLWMPRKCPPAGRWEWTD
jgi:hypothetical protein